MVRGRPPLPITTVSTSLLQQFPFHSCKGSSPFIGIIVLDKILPCLCADFFFFNVTDWRMMFTLQGLTPRPLQLAEQAPDRLPERGPDFVPFTLAVADWLLLPKHLPAPLLPPCFVIDIISTYTAFARFSACRLLLSLQGAVRKELPLRSLF